jgi:hypothetical protein
VPKVEIDTAELKTMVDKATMEAVKKQLKGFDNMISDIADIKGALLGSDFSPIGAIKKVDELWDEYKAQKEDGHVEKVKKMWEAFSFIQKLTAILTFINLSQFIGLVALVIDYLKTR